MDLLSLDSILDRVIYLVLVFSASIAIAKLGQENAWPAFTSDVRRAPLRATTGCQKIVNGRWTGPNQGKLC